MTHTELLAIARKRGTVRWNKSGLVEHLWVNKKGYVLARIAKQPKVHRIWVGRKLLTATIPEEGELTFSCVEVDSRTKAPIVVTDVVAQ